MTYRTAPDFPDNPLHALARWADDAEAAGEPTPRTMTLGTADADGNPHGRTVLTTLIDDEAVRFHTSRPTTKSLDLTVNRNVSGVFYWPSLARQVTLHGAASEFPSEVSRQAFPTRPRQLQVIAWVYDELNDDAPVTAADPDQVRRLFDEHGKRDPLPMPPSWTTIRVVPHRMAFWISHGPENPPTRVLFHRTNGGGWRHLDVLP